MIPCEVMRRACAIFLVLAFACNGGPKPPVAVASAAPSAVDAGGTSTAKLVVAGADPKAPLVYAFSNKTRTVSATISIIAGASLGAQPPIHVTFTATPKPNATGATVDIKLTKFEVLLPTTASPKEAEEKAVIEKAIVGMGGHFDVTSHGDIENLDLETEKGSPAVRELGGMIQQAIEFLVIPLPNEPVGVGAKWSKSESKTISSDNITLSTVVTLTLEARDHETATIKVYATNAGTMEMTDPRAPKGSSMERKTTATFTVVTRRDGVSRKVDGDSTNEITQKVPGQDDQSMTIKITQHLESE